VKWFVDEQLKVERWRKKKYSAEVHLIAEEAKEQAEKIQQEGMNREEVAENFLKLWDEVADSSGECKCLVCPQFL
jgi:NTP pyrophosphatase (non-canonical NTP hydrolase)